MNRNTRIHAVPLIALMLCSVGWKARAQEGTPAIRIAVDRVNVGVIVTDGRGKFVEGLSREDFHIFDNGIEQPLTNFAAVDEPSQVFLLVEAGPAVYLLESGHLAAASALINGLSPGDRIAVARYADAPETVLNFTTDKSAAFAALDHLRFNLGFGALNLASSLAQTLDWLSPLQGKKTIVLLSTGLDSSPPDRWEQFEEKLKTADVRVLAVSLAGELRGTAAKGKNASTPAKSAVVNGFEEADRTLQSMATATGGRAYFPQNARQFAAVYEETAAIVRHEYSLGFAPASRDGQIHAIEVRVTPRSLNKLPATTFHIDHRQAYFAPRP